MVVGILPNSDRDVGLHYTKTIVEWLEAQGLAVLLEETAAVLLGKANRLPLKKLFGSVDMVVVLGGDGTMLRASHYAAYPNTPLLGINVGTLGYLTDVERQDAFIALEKVLKGDFKKETRIMLEIEGDLPLHNRLALNDVCVTRGASGKLISLSLSINGVFMEHLRADGVIIATPTGSTGYNLSAGGPILKPDSEMIALTAVCPHALDSRPWVIPAGDEVSLRQIGADKETALVTLDGEPLPAQSLHINAEKGIIIRKSRYTVTVIKTSSLNFYEVLRRKMAKSPGMDY